MAPVAAWARLGETPAELARRYGPPVQTAQFDTFTRCRYERSNVEVDVYFLQGRSVTETFLKRGMSPDEADRIVAEVAGAPAPAAPPQSERQIRQASGITARDEIFWSWNTAAATVTAAFDPLECKLAFFCNPAVYARVQRALATAPMLGSSGPDA